MYQMHISTKQVFLVMLRSEKGGNPKKKCEHYERPNNNQTEFHEIEPKRRKLDLCMRDIILRFEMNLWNLLYSSHFNSIRILKQVPKYVATGL
jgi:hypothetical protein